MKSKGVSKRQVEQTVQGLASRINRCLGILEARIQRSERNDSVVRDGQRRLESEKAAGHYTAAAKKLATDRQFYVAQRERLYQQVLSLNATISTILEELGVKRVSKKPRAHALQQQRQTAPSPAPQPSAPGHRVDASFSAAGKEPNDLSRRAMEQHAAAVLGIDPTAIHRKRGRS